MGQTVGHGFDEAQVSGFEFQAAQLFALGQIFDHEQGGGGDAARLPLEGNNVDVEDRSRRVLRLILEARDG